MKNWLIVSFSIVIFGLFSISLAKADLVITVKYNDGCPAEGVWVGIWTDATRSAEVCVAFTDKDGKSQCSGSCSTDYWIRVCTDGTCNNELWWSPLSCPANINLFVSCPSGNCVDGYCCDSACDLPDQSCNLPGKEGICTPKYHVVNQTSACITGDSYYSSIQSAVDAASSDDEIIVCPGTYYENVIVNKTVSLIGENKQSIIDCNGTNTGILVTEDNVTIQEFTIQNCEIGIKVESDDNVISSNLVSSSGHNETEVRTNQEIYQDFVSPVNRWYLHNLINGSYTGFFNITEHTPAISVQALGHEDVNQLGIALFHDKNDDHEPQLQEYVGYGDVKERNVQGFLVNPPVGQYIIKVLGWEVPEDLGHFDLEITKYAGYGIAFLSSRNNIIAENVVTQNPVGLYLYDSHNSTILSNDAVDNVGGIAVSNSTECVISNNNASLNKFGSSICRQFGVGLTLWSAHDFYISENNVSSNTFGIWLFNSYDNKLVGNNMFLNGAWALGLHASHENTVSYNNMSLTTGLDGVRLQFATQNNITQNYISHNNHAGIYFWQNNTNNSITKNKFYSNGGHGVELKLWCNNNTIADNDIRYNELNGILILESTDNIVTRNYVFSNARGIISYDSSDNKIYHNNIIDSWGEQGADFNSVNIWDDGYPSGGNYWNDYDTPGEGCYDNNYDGFCDDQYPVGENQDNYPFMQEDAWLSVPPKIIILFPEAKNYSIETLWLHVIAGKPVDEWWYNLNSGDNTSFVPDPNMNITAEECFNDLVVYASSEFGEVSDNVQFNALKGDADGDLDVDIFDIVLCAGAYGTNPTMPKWKQQCDLNPAPDGDGQVNIFDIVSMAGKYGRSC